MVSPQESKSYSFPHLFLISDVFFLLVAGVFWLLVAWLTLWFWPSPVPKVLAKTAALSDAGLLQGLNPSFEETDETHEILLWRAAGQRKMTISLDPTVVYAGRFAVKLETLAKGSSNWLATKPVAVEGGLHYHLSCQVCSTASSCLAAFSFLWKGDSFSQRQSSPSLRVENRWQPMQIQFQAPQAARELWLGLVFYGSPGPIWLDDLRLLKTQTFPASAAKMLVQAGDWSGESQPTGEFRLNWGEQALVSPGFLTMVGNEGTESPAGQLVMDPGFPQGDDHALNLRGKILEVDSGCWVEIEQELVTTTEALCLHFRLRSQEASLRAVNLHLTLATDACPEGIAVVSKGARQFYLTRFTELEVEEVSGGEGRPYTLLFSQPALLKADPDSAPISLKASFLQPSLASEWTVSLTCQRFSAWQMSRWEQRLQEAQKLDSPAKALRLYQAGLAGETPPVSWANTQYRVREIQHQIQEELADLLSAITTGMSETKGNELRQKFHRRYAHCDLPDQMDHVWRETLRQKLKPDIQASVREWLQNQLQQDLPKGHLELAKATTEMIRFWSDTEEAQLKVLSMEIERKLAQRAVERYIVDELSRVRYLAGQGYLEEAQELYRRLKQYFPLHPLVQGKEFESHIEKQY